MSLSRFVLGLAAGFVLLPAIVVAAPARPRAMDTWSEDRDADPPEGFLPRLSAQAGVLCVKQCPNDSLPCDPPSYKVADGRCTTQWR